MLLCRHAYVLGQGRPGAPRFNSATESSLTFEWNAAPVTPRQGLAEGFELQVRHEVLESRGQSFRSGWRVVSRVE